MTEAELVGKITDRCSELGLLWHHCGDSRRCDGPAGFPDLVIATRGGIIVAEVKSQDGETSAEQDLWLWTLGGMAVIWRPADWESGLIDRHLNWILQ